MENGQYSIMAQNKILLNRIKQYLKTTLSVHTKFFHIVNTFTDNYRKLDAVVTRATLNGNQQRNSEYWLHFLSCSYKTHHMQKLLKNSTTQQTKVYF